MHHIELLQDFSRAVGFRAITALRGRFAAGNFPPSANAPKSGVFLRRAAAAMAMAALLGAGAEARAQTPSAQFSAATASISEGDSGVANATLSITLSAAFTSTTTLNFTYGVDADSGTDDASANDYTATATLNVPASGTSHSLTLPIVGDNIVETNEVVVVTLASGSGYTVGSQSTIAVTINDDDEAYLRVEAFPPWILNRMLTITVILDAQIQISPAGSTGGSFEVFGSGSLSETTRMYFTDTTGPGGIGAADGLLTDHELTETARFVYLREDRSVWQSNIIPTGSTLPAGMRSRVRSRGVLRTAIVSSAPTTPVVAFSQELVRVIEGGTVILKVGIAPQLTSASSVNISYGVDGFADSRDAASNDYTAVTTLTLPANADSAFLEIPATVDSEAEGEERAIVTLAGISSAPYTLGMQKKSIVLIIENDTPLTRPTPAVPPDAPTLAAPLAGSGTLTLNWTAPINYGNAPITGYKVRWALASAATDYLNRPGGASGTDVSGGSAAVTYTIPSLIGATAYQVQVAAVNTHGTGDWSPVQTATPPGPPGMPILAAPLSGSGTLTLNWSAPANTGGSAIGGYKVRWALASAATIFLNSAGGNGNDVPGGGSVTTYTIPMLAAGAAYQVQIAAVNVTAAGAWTAAQTASTHDVPSAPRSVTSVIADAMLTLSWAAPDNDGGAAVSDYLIRWALASAAANYLNAGGENGETSGIDDLMHTITGLTNGMLYEVQIAAVNSAGTGAWSAVHRNNPALPPDAPGVLNVQPGSGLLTLSWTAPADDGGDDITVYVVRWAESDNSGVWVNLLGEDGNPTDSTDLVYVLGGLESATTYEVQVAARNDAGTGPWTASVEGETSSFNVDIDASGTVDSTDALLIARYLTGLRGDALVANLNLDATQTSTKVAAKINAGVLLGVLNIDGQNGTTAADGIMFARYHLGVTEGAALTDGMSGVDPATVKMKIMNLPMP